MYKIQYLKSVVKVDIPKLTKLIRIRIKNAIEQKISIQPVKYGKPLQYSLKGCRRHRVEDYRIIYTIENDIILIVKIAHTKEVYL